MNELLRTLLDLNHLSWGEQGVAFGFERPLAAWAWGLVIVGALGVSLWSYWRLSGLRVMRGVLGLLRGALLVLLVVLIAGPQLVQRSESVENDWVLVMVDRSASMTIEDGVSPTTASGRESREAQLREALGSSWPMWRELSKDRVVVWLGFDRGAYDLPMGGSDSGSSETGELDLGEPDGERSRFGAALDQALARASARPLAAVVVLSDGKWNDQPTRSAVRRLQSERVPVHTVALGSRDAIADIAIQRIDAPKVAFMRDRTPVRVHLERIGGDPAQTASALVRLIDRATGITLSEERVQWGPGQTDASAALLTSSDVSGTRRWEIEVIPDGVGGSGGDLISGNNTQEIGIELIDRPLRVLYVDGYPRWEQRYLKNLLVREQSITSSTLILAPNRKYLQEGDIVLDVLPESPEEWAQFDAVIIGDVHPEVFTDDQLANLKEHISRRGGGLIWIGGEGATPRSWFDSPIGDLLPFRRDATDGSAIGTEVVMTATPVAKRLSLMQLGESSDQWWPSELADPTTGWSLLRWAQRIERDRLKPAAEVLAQSIPGQWPLVMTMRYGAGRSMYVATDETWRWRYGRGELLQERFWLQMIRLLGRESLSRSGKLADLEIAPRRADVDQPVRVTVTLLDQELIDEGLATIGVEMTRQVVGEEQDTAGGSTVGLVLKPTSSSFETYSAVWLPPFAGVWNAKVVDSLLSGLKLEGELVVSLADDELRHPESDHESLARLSEATGGSVIQPGNLDSLAERIPNRRRVLLNEQSEPLWDTPFALILVILLLTVEWVGRRVIRLV